MTQILGIFIALTFVLLQMDVFTFRQRDCSVDIIKMSNFIYHVVTDEVHVIFFIFFCIRCDKCFLITWAILNFLKIKLFYLKSIFYINEKLTVQKMMMTLYF